MDPASGIVRTASGRQTYAPDGIISSQQPERHLSDALSTSTSKTLEGAETPKKTSSPDYLTQEGKEAVEESIEPSSSSEDLDKQYGQFDNDEKATLQRLASQMSRGQSYYSRRSSNAAQSTDLERVNTIEGMELNDPQLDPNSPKFDLHKWIRMVMKMVDEDDVKIARAGITIRDVTVRGTGSALNLQKNVGSFLMAPLRIQELVNFGHKQAKTIIRNFDGIMKSGEMLIVLGRPGSGCSTLLKTMTGEMHGLQVDKDSTVHYNGITQDRMMKEFKGEVVYNQEVDKHFP